MQPEHSFITQLYDRQPDSAVWFTPVFGESQAVLTDFQIGYCNTAASLLLKTPKEQIIGSSLRSSELMDERSIQTIWEQCSKIWTSGDSLEFTYYSESLQRHLNVQRSKVLNGVLSITRDHTRLMEIKAEQEVQANLLQQIIETSPNGISVYEAIRTHDGKLTDFKLKLANRRSAEITAFSLEELYKYTVKELMVIRGHSDYFDMVSRVVETGEPVYTELYAEPRDQWIALSILKFNDGYLLNYIDITLTKKLEKQARDQADMLKGIFNASITGLMTLRAIYDSSGQVEDFKLVLLNDAAGKVFGLKELDQEKSYLTLFPTARTNGFFDLYANALKTGEPVTKEIFYKGDGYNGWYYISVSKMNQDTLVQSFSDIGHTKEPKCP